VSTNVERTKRSEVEDGPSQSIDEHENESRERRFPRNGFESGRFRIDERVVLSVGVTLNEGLDGEVTTKEATESDAREQRKENQRFRRLVETMHHVECIEGRECSRWKCSIEGEKRGAKLDRSGGKGGREELIGSNRFGGKKSDLSLSLFFTNLD
jgi:hypothetical protein